MSIFPLPLNFDQLPSCWLPKSNCLVAFAALHPASSPLPHVTQLAVAKTLQLFLLVPGLYSLNCPGGLLETLWLLVLLIYTRFHGV